MANDARAKLIEAMARGLCAVNEVDPDEIGYDGKPHWQADVYHAEAVLVALQAAGFSVVPRLATKAQVEAANRYAKWPTASMYDPTPRGAWSMMVSVADLAPSSSPEPT